jgi:hypothetical protein
MLFAIPYLIPYPEHHIGIGYTYPPYSFKFEYGCLKTDTAPVSVRKLSYQFIPLHPTLHKAPKSNGEVAMDKVVVDGFRTLKSSC